jgi:phosphatidylinositol alpha-1,6-mannosyltransferase
VDIPRVLVVTNDFPPRVGGVQQYVWNLTRHLPPDRVAVLAPNWPGWREHDADQPFPVHRWPTEFLWPTTALAERVRSLLRRHRADVVLFGHGFPLPLLSAALDHSLPTVALTHGAEVWLARTPGLAAAMRRGLAGAREVTAVSRSTARTIRRLLPDGAPLSILYPGVDEGRFSPAVDGEVVRTRHELGDRPIILCVSRLVPRKGQDVLIRALPMVQHLVPDAALLLVGGGPYRATLGRLGSQAPPGAVVFAGEVPSDEVPSYYAACDVFAMPCRSRWAGLEVEGFGIVFLEAAASGKPVVAGRSGGADEAVADEETGLLVEGSEPKAVALAVARLLSDRAMAGRMGAAGRARVEAEFTWERQAARLGAVLRSAAGTGGVGLDFPENV